MQRRFQSIGRAVFAAALSFTLAGAAGAAQQPDAWVTTKVKMSLLTTDGVSATNVHVDTIEGRVTLHGSVPTEARRRARSRSPLASMASARCGTCCRSSHPSRRRRRTPATRRSRSA